MIFNELAQWFDRLEAERSRLAMAQMLSELFKQLSAHEAQFVSYFCLGEFAPPYRRVPIGLADKSVLKTVANVLGVSTAHINEQLKDVSDLGVIVAQGTWHTHHALSIEQIYDELCAIARITGEGSQDTKNEELARLLTRVSPVAAKYIVRIVLGVLRLGFSDMTIIDALSWMLVGDKSVSKKIEHAYNVCADIGYISLIVKEKGLAGIEDISVIVGIPIRPAAAERLSSPADIIEKLGPCVAEPKLDGFRLQIHINKRTHHNSINFFSRNLLDMSAMYPDLVRALELLDVHDVIFEGEAIVFNPDTGNFMPFQETVKRKRKHEIEEQAHKMPLQLFLFDLLYLNGKELLSTPLHERRKHLVDVIQKSPIDKNVIRVIQEESFSTAKELENYFLLQVNAGLEGIVVKRPDSLYQPGKRNFNWIKLKRLEKGHLLDTVDCVILGYYYGMGKRAAFGIGALLVGVYNKSCDCFQTIAKVGTGFSDEQWKEVRGRCDKLVVALQPKNVSCDKGLYPDVWITPEQVIEVAADELTRSPVHTAGHTDHTLGLALRFPRFMRYRDDKDAYETTSVDELDELFQQQHQKK